MTDLPRLLDETVSWLNGRTAGLPAVAIVLGSGWDALAEAMAEEAAFGYDEVPHFPRPEVHAGVLKIGTVNGLRVACLRGRCHGYEGRTPNEVAYAVRAMARWGVETVVLTNAAGGIRADLTPGDLMLIDDHVNLTATNPLVGGGDALGSRFVDMTRAYDVALGARAKEAAHRIGLSIKTGVYACTLGPMYETPAEIRSMAALGIDAIGMSTVWETIALRQMGVRVAGISCITNKAAGITGDQLSHEDILSTAERVKENCVALLSEFLGEPQ